MDHEKLTGFNMITHDSSAVIEARCRPARSMPWGKPMVDSRLSFLKGIGIWYENWNDVIFFTEEYEVFNFYPFSTLHIAYILCGIKKSESN